MLIVFSILEFFPCGSLFAIIPLILAIQSRLAYKAGDIERGDSKAEISKTALIVIFVTMVISYMMLLATGRFAI